MNGRRSDRVLVPFNKREGMTLRQAALVAGKSESTLRNWCVDYGIGRRVGGGIWTVSRVALAMHLDGDRGALAAYLDGDRSVESVIAYFHRLDLGALIREFQLSEDRP
jgi:hypothetical protein